jgi:NAD(P)-dependent dehydrogenase (short-subunit alcohol dehydrogenase family)
MSDKIRYVRQLSAESAGEAPGRGRLQGRKILVVGGGQRTFDAATDPVGNGRAMSLLFAREGAHVAVADMNRASADDTVQRIMAEGGQRGPAVADRGGRAVRADGDRLGNRLCGAVFHLRRERLRQRPGAGGRQRHHRAVSQNPGRRFHPPAGRSGQ